MADKLTHECRVIETDDGFRIEIKGDKNRLRELFGHGMEEGCGMGHGHGIGGLHGLRGLLHGHGHSMGHGHSEHSHSAEHGHPVEDSHSAKNEHDADVIGHIGWSESGVLGPE